MKIKRGNSISERPRAAGTKKWENNVNIFATKIMFAGYNVKCLSETARKRGCW